jgi:hypothetical protein
MARLLEHSAMASIFLTGATIFFACGERPYTGGDCAEPADCVGVSQFIPGTTCRDEDCVCADPKLVICCRRGEEDDPGCLYQCLPCEECGGDVPECAGRVCKSDAECSGPPDPRCGVGRCVEGACAVEVNAGPLESQVRGDCVRLECTPAGAVVSVQDQTDSYDDGNQCTIDLCDHERPMNPMLVSVICPVTGLGRCRQGECVACDAGDSANNDCGGGLACDGVLCVPRHCVDNDFDPRDGETAQDCGGPCRPCSVDFACRIGGDCVTGVCEAGLCKAPTCGDHVKNDSETGVDCGAASCPLCPAGQGCITGANCQSGVCWAGVCETPTCTDGVKNGDERGVDCGGGCTSACPG